MKPTLQVGDFILVNKFIYGIRLPVLGTKVIEIDQPERGDSMVFIPSHKNQYFIKRVIGLPGDRVRYQNKVIYINNVEQNQKYLGPLSDAVSAPLQFIETLDGKTHAMWRNRYEDPGAQEWLVPEGHYFMMGDNRDQSSDSRFWGFVREDKIVGKAFAIWLHKEPGLAMPTFGRNQWID
jgi:signal peptidase I